MSQLIPILTDIVTGVGRCSSQSGSEREAEEVCCGATTTGAEPTAPLNIPESEELARRKEEARRKRRRKKRSGSSVVTSCFNGKHTLWLYLFSIENLNSVLNIYGFFPSNVISVHHVASHTRQYSELW